jgi:hypothetical protein
VSALKENQPTLPADVRQLFLADLENDCARVKHRACHAVDDGHGRVEQR